MSRTSTLTRLLGLLIVCSAAAGPANAAGTSASRQPVLGSNEASIHRPGEDMSSVLREAYSKWDAGQRSRPSSKSRIRAASVQNHPDVNGCPAQPAVRRIKAYQSNRLGRDAEPIELRARFAPATRVVNVSNMTQVPTVSCNSVGRLISIESGPVRRLK